jgi:hypothetical protein
MKTFRLVKGDFVLQGNSLEMVSGAARVQQQLSLGIRETFGADRFHPGWGSMISEWIGRVSTASVQDDIRNEITRVVRAHIMVQNDRLRRASTSGQRGFISMDEVIAAITSITFSQKEDSLIVRVRLRTAGFQEFTILTSTAGAV